MTKQVTVYQNGDFVYTIGKGGVVHQYVVLESGDLAVVTDQ